MLRVDFRRDFVAQQTRFIDHLAAGAELDGAVRVALARRERIAERHDEKILDHDLAIDQLATVWQLDRHRHAGICAVERIWNARDG